ncbi:exodeoxyribonuclease III [Asticcacaulis excentricus]|uniref:Exodeoxyribonuclease III Xth n=1 Tax=Asticcacaulis excentricus (strain ATCC 15261 / DSM 4724 / KCTC 12464 / NCIMB 9791 / VKM B-1370 / CB 48) TaxID=573065 RepID=E8RPZ4_ASTEC|nr:exodeoxyribonuclease III [Asticcacaulis excentricus]ADU13167.1 exodeoxyribonuclease III Xth [Asticcacaulis excentricus CB 48]
MKIFTYNVNSVNARLPLILEWFEETQPDVCALQELKCLDEKFPYEPFERLGYNAAVHGQKTWNGVALLSKQPLIDVVRGLPGEPEDEQSRYIEAVVDGSVPVRVTSIYLPNGNPIGTDKYPYKHRWYKRLQARAKEILAFEEISVLSGDFNTIPTKSDLYRESAWLDDALYQPETRAAYQSLKNLGYSDACDLMPPEGNRYTFWDYQAGAWQKNEGIRIDHHLLSPQAADRLKSFEIHKDARGRTHDDAKPSDHVPVGVELDV